MIQNTLNYLFKNKTLSRIEAKKIVIDMALGKFNTSEMSAILTVFNMRMVSLNELIGFREALLELRIRIDFSDFQCIDLCGTGGDAKDTFNISTLASFVVAGAGYKVAKHGNYGVSSISGSSNMLENLGYIFTNNQEKLKTQLTKTNICFLHAPLFNPAMKNIAPIRRELGVKTFFNMLGPMVNPAQPKYQLTGVFNLELARLYNYIYQKSNIDYTIIHSLDGYDEVSLTSETKLYSNTGEALLSPKDFQSKILEKNQIRGGNTVEENTRIFQDILDGEGTHAQNSVVIANSALAIQVLTKKSYQSCYKQAQKSLYDGHAKNALLRLIDLS